MVNLLQQPQSGMQPQLYSRQQPPPRPPSPQQVIDFHTHASYMQKMLDGLIKLPDDKLDLSAIYDAASDMVHENLLSDGKRGITAQEVAKEMSDPNFPTADTDPEDIRAFLQNYFDKSVQMQAAVTAKLGGPQQLAQQMQPQAPVTAPSNDLTGGQQ